MRHCGVHIRHYCISEHLYAQYLMSADAQSTFLCEPEEVDERVSALQTKCAVLESEELHFPSDTAINILLLYSLMNNFTVVLD